MTPLWSMLICYASAFCGIQETTPDIKVILHLPSRPESLVFGRPFPIEIERQVPLGIDLAPLTRDSIEELVLTDLKVKRSVGEGGLREHWKAEASAFALGTITLSASRVRSLTTDGREVRSKDGEPTILQVASALDPKDPLEAELPGDLRSRPEFRFTLALIILTIVALLARSALATQKGEDERHAKDSTNVPAFEDLRGRILSTLSSTPRTGEEAIVRADDVSGLLDLAMSSGPSKSPPELESALARSKDLCDSCRFSRPEFALARFALIALELGSALADEPKGAPSP